MSGRNVLLLGPEYTIAADFESLPREMILEEDPDARFVGDDKTDWTPRDGVEQDRLWHGERNNGPNCAVFDDEAADEINDYFGDLWIEVEDGLYLEIEQRGERSKT